MQPAVGQVVTVLRSRLVPGDTGYGDDASRVAELARAVPGHVEHGVHRAGRRAGHAVTSADEASHASWRDHPQHRAAMRRGVAGCGRACTTQGGTTSCASAWSRA